MGSVHSPRHPQRTLLEITVKRVEKGGIGVPPAPACCEGVGNAPVEACLVAPLLALAQKHCTQPLIWRTGKLRLTCSSRMPPKARSQDASNPSQSTLPALHCSSHLSSSAKIMQGSAIMAWVPAVPYRRGTGSGGWRACFILQGMIWLEAIRNAEIGAHRVLNTSYV